jgi:mono/diheme cytochrome c family protein
MKTSLLLLAAACLAFAQSPSAQNGRKLFDRFGCYECHQHEGEGAAATGPRLGPHPIPYANFTRYVRQPTGQMPPYTAKVVKDSELADIYAFLQSLPDPRPVKDIPLLNQ